MYELVKDGQGTGRRQEQFHELAAHKGVWLPVVIEDKPPFNPAKAYLEKTTTTTETEVTDSFAVKKKTLVEVTQERRGYIFNEFTSRKPADNPELTLFSEQARLFKRNSNAPVKALKRRATKAGITPAAMRDKIIAESDGYETLLGDVRGQSDKLNSDIDTILASGDTPTQKITAILGVSWT